MHIHKFRKMIKDSWKYRDRKNHRKTIVMLLKILKSHRDIIIQRSAS